MPKGDTIWRTAAALRPRLVGRRVLAARPAGIGRLAQRTVTAVEARGKHLLIRFEGGWTLHSHMRMSGSWHLYQPGERWQRPERQARAVLECADVVAVCFNAPVVDVVRDDTTAVAHLGPDILADPFDLDEVVRRAALADAPTVGELLLDQRVCAGIGNIYRCDSLWVLRLNPWSAPGEIAEDELRRCYATARDLMRHALGAAGQRPLVHGRSGRPCPRCGRPVAMRAQGHQARLVYWCRHCQGTAPRPVSRAPVEPGPIRRRAGTGQ
ncbi:MAG: Fpg/Nei family DNA glycosylase [Candidatus Dormibacteria bacterium]